jgi:hypothetical protein
MVLSLFGAGLAKDLGNDVSGARNILRRAMRRTPLPSSMQSSTKRMHLMRQRVSDNTPPLAEAGLSRHLS